MTAGIHTGALESVHSLYTKYAPKRSRYTKDGITALLQMGAMDHNHNVQRKQATTAAGQPRYKLQYSKAAKNYVVKPIKEPKKHSYRQELLKSVAARCLEGKALL